MPRFTRWPGRGSRGSPADPSRAGLQSIVTLGRWTCTSSGRSRRRPSGQRSMRSSVRDIRLARAVTGARRRRATSPAAGTTPGRGATSCSRSSTRSRSRIGLDQPAGAQLRLPAPQRPAGRGLRRRHVLRAVRDEAAPADRRPRLRRHRLPARRRRGPDGGPRADARIRPATPSRDGRSPGSAARASACASARLPRCSRSPDRTP